MSKKTLFFDLETHSSTERFNMPPRQFVRTMQYAWGREGDIHITTDYDEMIGIVESADLSVTHNGISYDYTALYGPRSMRPLELSLENKVWDTMVAYQFHHRVPIMYENREGQQATTYSEGKQKVALVMRYLALDNLTYQHGLPGKAGDLQALAKKYNPPKTPVAELDYGLIPLDDPDFLDYARQDIVALRALATHLVDHSPVSAYEWREMQVQSVNEQMSRNGFAVNKREAQARVDALLAEKEEKMDWLVAEFDFPTAGKQPWKSAAGKGAILKAFDHYGLHFEDNPDWERTKNGAPSFGREALLKVAEGTEAEPLARALGTLQGQRSLAELALSSTHEDGRAHPSITALQRSGRFSMSNPSLPIWTARGPGAVEKRYFVASPGCKLVEMDMSNADQRIVAALSGDPNYAKRFEPGVDGHEVSGRLMFGDEDYDSDPKGKRNTAKALSHAFAYGAGVKTLARTSKLPESDDPEQDPLYLAQKFVTAMNRAYPYNKQWREDVGEAGKSGWVSNEWGRKMAVDPDRAWTQTPGLLGQSGTRELLVDGLLTIANEKIEVLRWLVATVHDAVIWDIPESELGWAVPWIKRKLERTFQPKRGGQPIFFPWESGEPADDWFAAGH